MFSINTVIESLEQRFSQTNSISNKFSFLGWGARALWWGGTRCVRVSALAAHCSVAWLGAAGLCAPESCGSVDKPWGDEMMTNSLRRGVVAEKKPINILSAVKKKVNPYVLLFTMTNRKDCVACALLFTLME